MTAGHLMRSERSAAVVAALHRACRKDWFTQYHPLHNVKSDEAAANWAVHVQDVMRELDPKLGYETVRRLLKEEVAAGSVISARPHYHSVRYWPVGLWEKLQQEKAQPKLCGTCQGDGLAPEGGAP